MGRREEGGEDARERGRGSGVKMKIRSFWERQRGEESPKKGPSLVDLMRGQKGNHSTWSQKSIHSWESILNSIFRLPEPEMPNHRHQTRSRKMGWRDDLREAIMERE